MRHGTPSRYVDVWIDIETTDFSLPARRKRIRVEAGRDSEAIVFLATALRSGDLRLLVQAYAAGETLLASGLLKVRGTSKWDETLAPLKALVSLSLGLSGSVTARAWNTCDRPPAAADRTPSWQPQTAGMKCALSGTVPLADDGAAQPETADRQRSRWVRNVNFSVVWALVGVVVATSSPA